MVLSESLFNVGLNFLARFPDETFLVRFKEGEEEEDESFFLLGLEEDDFLCLVFKSNKSRETEVKFEATEEEIELDMFFCLQLVLGFIFNII